MSGSIVRHVMQILPGSHSIGIRYKYKKVNWLGYISLDI